MQPVVGCPVGRTKGSPTSLATILAASALRRPAQSNLVKQLKVVVFDREEV